MSLKTEYVEVTKKEIQTKAVICDTCGLETPSDHWEKAQSYVSFKLSFGYGSKFDLEIHRFHLCEPCYEKMLSLMGIKPHIGEYMPLSGEEMTPYPPEPIA